MFKGKINLVKVCICLGFVFFKSLWAGQISGKIVLHDSVDARKINFTEQTVRLSIFKDNQEVAGAETVCDKNGNFHFDRLNTSQDYSYAYYTVFQSVMYTFDMVKFENGQEKIDAGEHTIYESTSKLSAIQSDESFFISVGKNDVMKVEHQIRLSNTSNKTYYYSESDKDNAIQLNLIKGVYDLHFLNGIYTSTFDLNREDQSLTFKEYLFPGKDAQRVLKYSYLVPLNSATMNHITQLPILRKSVNVFIDDLDISFSSPQLSQKAIVQMFGKKQQLFSGEAIPENTNIEFKFKHLPTTRGFAIKILLGGGILALLLFMGLIVFDKKITLSKEEKVKKVYQRLAALKQSLNQKKCSQRVYEKQRDAYIQYLVYLEQ